MAFPYRMIVCPVDFDDNSLHALDHAIEIARHFAATITIVHVVPMVIELPADMPSSLDRYAEQEKAAKAKLNEIVANKLGGVSHECTTYVGDIVDGILREVGRSKPDLVVMATHGRSGLAHFLLGSVTEAVVRKAGCPVLVVHGEPEPAGT